MSATDTHDVPNLDAMTVEELHEAHEAFTALARYACVKASAMQWRAAGEVATAVFYEQQAEACYRRLPASYRW